VITANVETKAHKYIDKIYDPRKLAWAAFEFVDNAVPVKTGRLKSSIQLIAGTTVLLKGEPIKHYSKKMSRFKISLTYSTPKEAGENANVFYTYGSGKFFDYAVIVEKRKHFLFDVLKLNFRQIMKRSRIK